MGSLLMPLLSSVAAKVGDVLVGELLRAWGLDAAHRKLERHLAAVQHILLDAEAKSRTNPAVRQWVSDLKTAAYQADDVLDNFRYEALHRRAQTRRSMPTTRKVLSYFTVDSPIVFRFSMSRKMKDVIEKIDELVVEMNNFHFLTHTKTPSIVHPQTHSRVDESEIVGKLHEKEQVVKILLENQCDNNNVMVLPIVGMGGIGKTTLAQLVHNDQRVMHHFDLVIWICVSDQFVVEEIIRSIIEVATMKKCELIEMEALQKKLSQVLGKKRYLLVMDDVWNEDRQKWDGLRLLLCSDAGSGSAIIVTSRSNQVASVMGTIRSHQISLLNEDQSWELFHRNAFVGEVEKQDELILMARNIVQKCKGLPLAIKTIAALLRMEHHNEWFSILDSDVWKNEILRTGFIPALQLSYDHLSPEAKICFSFCVIFPKGSMLDKDMLIQLWLANDFIASETRGQQIFEVLVWRCFLQDVKTQENLLSGFRDEYIHRPTACKMHDLMHDLAESVSENDCTILQKYSPNESMQGSTHDSLLLRDVRHLSLVSINNTRAAMKDIIAPRTIIFQKEWFGTPLIMAESKFMSLRALKAFSIKTRMTNLKHLRYLDCSYSLIRALPEATSMLYSLQTLKLIGCQNLKKLPEGMRCMINLRHIFLIGCYYLEHMPKGIGQLSYLQTLTNYVIDSDTSRGIDQVKDLNLGGALSLIGLRKVHSAENAKEGNISAKHNLKCLSLDWYGPYSTHVGDEVHNAEGILEALHPPKRLQVLQLSNYTGAQLSLWMHDSILLEHLSELSLSSCKNIKDLPPLWQLPSLVYLSLDGLHDLTRICIGNVADNGESCMSPPLFPKLETMKVSSMPKLERWHQEATGQVAVISFPQLKKLKISECPMLASMPRMLPLLEDLEVRWTTKIPFYHMMNQCVQSNLECKGYIEVEPAGWLMRDIHLSRFRDSDVSLKLKDLVEHAEHFEEELKRIPCRFIKKMKIIDCNCLFSSEPSQIQRNIWNRFVFVEDLWIIGCSNIVQWPTVEFRNLNYLQSLHLSNCSNLTGSLPSTSDAENVLPPRLKKLAIVSCENMMEVPKLPASLEELHIAYCHKLVTVPTILGNARNLRRLFLAKCDALTTAVPDGMYRPTALKELNISECPMVETLTDGLLQQLLTLEGIYIGGCPDLERALASAFSRGGAYWHLVEANSHRGISTTSNGIRLEQSGEMAAAHADEAINPCPRCLCECAQCCTACLFCTLCMLC
ncbi:putative disease resistance protein RGA3 [Triticum dicoccoides]|uniref:putative disease resistance protein RGA3 n=1 Tax=Triticum dicoccoides TaxID=85692 RepID=UPI0018911B2F|nr:putative disease resistance protein RGA3 [Triticum dicoccoides]